MDLCSLSAYIYACIYILVNHNPGCKHTKYLAETCQRKYLDVSCLFVFLTQVITLVE